MRNHSKTRRQLSSLDLALAPIPGQPGLFLDSFELPGWMRARKPFLYALGGATALWLLFRDSRPPLQVTESRRKWAPVLDAAAAKAGLPSSLIRGLAWVESRWEPSSVSGVGAIGLLQLMPGTASGLGVNPHDPAQNAIGGARYLKSLITKYSGNVRRALAAYNWGSGNIDRHPDENTWPASVRSYASNVLDAKSRGVV